MPGARRQRAPFPPSQPRGGDRAPATASRVPRPPVRAAGAGAHVLAGAAPGPANVGRFPGACGRSIFLHTGVPRRRTRGCAAAPASVRPLLLAFASPGARSLPALQLWWPAMIAVGGGRARPCVMCAGRPEVKARGPGCLPTHVARRDAVRFVCSARAELCCERWGTRAPVRVATGNLCLLSCASPEDPEDNARRINHA
jgi:hypothetical protein